MELTCMVHSIYSRTYPDLAEAVLDAVRKAGFELKILSRKAEYEDELRNAPADFVITRWKADFPDTDNFMYPLLHSADSLYGRFYGNPETDGLIAKGRSETDPATRHSIYRQIERIIAERCLLIPLFHEQTYCFARPEVQDMEVRFSMPAISYDKLWVKK